MTGSTTIAEDIVQEAFLATWRGEAESDGFNRLVLQANLSWREVAVLRAYCKYLRQAGTTFSQSYMEETLASHPHIARLLVKLFHARFDPRRRANAAEETARLAAEVEAALDTVASLDQDRILRSFLQLVQATLRTSYFQGDPQGRPKPYLSLKFDAARVPDRQDETLLSTPLPGLSGPEEDVPGLPTINRDQQPGHLLGLGPGRDLPADGAAAALVLVSGADVADVGAVASHEAPLSGGGFGAVPVPLTARYGFGRIGQPSATWGPRRSGRGSASPFPGGSRRSGRQGRRRRGGCRR